MKYRDSIEKSAEYLRLALPLMSKQATALHPVSYAVWYEYVAGGNSALKARIDEQLRSGAVLDEHATHALYQQHVAEINEEVARRVSEGFQKVLADVSYSAAQAGEEAGQFGSALGQWCAGLSAAERGALAGADTILGLAHGMQDSVGMLRERLDESRREIEQLRGEVSRAREDALADGLTGLANRRGFDVALAACIERPDTEAAGPSLLITDIDHFKRINDSYGHLFGDKVIRAVAQILKDNVKGRDTAARYGGEEFVVLLPDTPLAGARLLAEKIRASVERCRVRRTHDNESMANITVSLGVAAFKGGEAATEFVARADAALYESKNAGRNRVTVAAA